MAVVKELLSTSVGEWISAILIFMLLLFSIPTIIEQVNKMLVILGLKSVKKIEKEETDEKTKQFEEDIASVKESIKVLNDGIANLTTMMDGHIKKDDENNVAMIRSTLWRIHQESVSNGYITHEGLRTFTELGKVYESCGGDDIYHDKLHPDIMKLDVK